MRTRVAVVSAALLCAGCWQAGWQRVKPSNAPQTVNDSQYARVNSIALEQPQMSREDGAWVITGKRCRNSTIPERGDCRGHVRLPVAPTDGTIEVRRQEWSWPGFAFLTGMVVLATVAAFGTIGDLSGAGLGGGLGP